jgi:urate oxidase
MLSRTTPRRPFTRKDHGVTADGFAYQISYGKRAVPVYRTAAAPLRVAPIPESPFTGRANHLLAAAIDVEVLGADFLPAYTAGDNSLVVATDSMKNFILRETLAYPGATLEGLLHHLGQGFISTYPQIRHLRIGGNELPFQPVPIPDPATSSFAPSDLLFDHRRGDHATATIELAGDDRGLAILDHRCGRLGLHLMKLRGSAFTAFVRDGYTTLPDRRDRPLFIFADLHWRYADPAALLAPDHARYVPSEQVRDLAATVFADFVSESIQHLVHEIGTRLLARFPQLAEVAFIAQNRTRDPAAESPTDDLAKVYTDPFPAYGEITLTLRRTRQPAATTP